MPCINPKKRTSDAVGVVPVVFSQRRILALSGIRLNHGPTDGVTSCETVNPIDDPVPSPFEERLSESNSTPKEGILAAALV